MKAFGLPLAAGIVLAGLAPAAAMPMTAAALISLPCARWHPAGCPPVT
ncbi:hypothetical protein [Paracoccus sp. 08]|nr:hypothetical protein [Paracoccus sp. 08]